MPGDAGYLKYVMELLAPLGDVTSRPMFGGYGVFQSGDMFALISGASLYFKVDGSNRGLYEQAGSRQFKPMPYYAVPAEVMEDNPAFLDWARRSATIAHATPTKKKQQRKP